VGAEPARPAGLNAVTTDSFWFRALDAVADAVNPALTLLAIAVPRLRGTWRGWPAAFRYWAAALGGLGVIYGLAALDAWFGLWAAMHLDYSTHTAYAVSLAATILCWDRRWAWLLVPALSGYALLILVLRYHGPADVLTAALVATPGSWAAYRLIGSSPGRSADRARPNATSDNVAER
jgi:hypothetical protein